MDRRGAPVAAETASSSNNVRDESHRYGSVSADPAADIIGRGGQAVGRKVVQLELSRVVAMRSPLGDGPEAHRVFELEKLFLAFLQHPNIASIIDSG